MKVAVTLILIATIVWCCQDNSRVSDSVKYQDEELNVYNQLLDNLLDSIGIHVVDSVKKVFYINDTLRNIDIDLETTLENRAYSISKIASNSRHKFIRESDTLSLGNHEYFTGKSLTISRVSFDKSMSNGFLELTTWCGLLCGTGFSFEIEKIEGKWRIKKRQVLWIS